MSAKHTPGRWWVSGADDDEVHCSIFVQDMDCNMHIALVKPPCVGGIIPAEQLKANARLIAAAPDLLILAQNVSNGVIVPELMTHEGLIEVLLGWQKAASAAIAKAIG